MNFPNKPEKASQQHLLDYKGLLEYRLRNGLAQYRAREMDHILRDTDREFEQRRAQVGGRRWSPQEHQRHVDQVLRDLEIKGRARQAKVEAEHLQRLSQAQHEYQVIGDVLRQRQKRQEYLARTIELLNKTRAR